MRNPVLKILNTACRMIFVITAIAGIYGKTVNAQSEVGLVISNQAQAIYKDAENKEYKTLSEIVSITVTAVYSLAVTPDENASSANIPQLAKFSRRFAIHNQGNAPDSYVLTSADITAPAIINELYFDNDVSHSLSAADQKIELNSTVSPVIKQNGSIDVFVVFNTGAIAPESLLKVELTARSTTDSSQQDSGQIINTVSPQINFTDPDDPTASPRLRINGQREIRVTNGQAVTYEIRFRNRSAVQVNNVVMQNELHSEVSYIPGTLKFKREHALTDEVDNDSGDFTAQKVQLRLDKVDPNELVTISYQARIKALKANSRIADTAYLWAENVSMTETSEAVALVDPYAVIFAARSNGQTTISGAQVTLADDNSSSPLALSSSFGFEPNQKNQNSFTTSNDGRYSFGLTAEQLGQQNRRVSYILRVAAKGYQSRLISVAITPADAHKGFYTAVLKALDNQRLAEDGSFILTDQEVTVNNFVSVAFNIPMFESTNLVIQKTADKTNAEIGDIITYQVNVQNATRSNVDNLIIKDQLPNGFIYATGSAKIQRESGAWEAIEPQIIDGSKLVFPLSALDLGEKFTISYRVRIGANVQPGVSVNTAVAEGVFPNGERTVTSPAQIGVKITNGVFSNRQALIGRVYNDKNGSGKFDAGDIPAAGVRVYTQKGQFVVTDSAGMYNFPALEDGAMVLQIDPVTIPIGLTASKSVNKSDQGNERLLQTPLLGGSLLQQNFALESKSEVENNKQKSESDFVKIKQNSSKSDDKNVGNIIDKQPETAQYKDNDVTAEAENPPVENDSNLSRKENLNAAEPKKFGTYKIESAENVEPLEIGKIDVVSPKINQVIMSSALEIEARVAAGWTIDLSVNGASINKDHIGTFKQFHKSKVDSFTFVGINLKSGSNVIVAKAVSPEGITGEKKELTVMGRGPAKKLQIVSERDRLRANGRDETEVIVRALDEWGNPALDNQVALSVSQGNLVLPGEKSSLSETEKFGAENNKIPGINTQIAPADAKRQQIVSLEKGIGSARIIAGNAPGNGEITATAGSLEAKYIVNYLPDLRPRLMVGLARASFGKAAPEMALRGIDSNFHSRIGLYYSGKILEKNLLTFSYDSERALNRTNGRDRLFEQDPLDRVHPLFGDSSTRFETAPSNSKLYARIDRGNSYAMFGDFETELTNLSLSGYSRKLTGAKVYLANKKGDFVSLTGARPETSFSRDTFPGNQLGLIQLSKSDVLQGSEVVVLETRDRRNPENIISREQLIRSVDYNLDPVSGRIFFLRPLMSFDSNLNLVQAVITYEYFNNGNSSNVYTGRAVKNFRSLGLKLGLSAVNQRQETLGSYLLAGFDGEKTTFNGGKIKFDYAMSGGRFAAEGNIFDSSGLLASNDEKHDGKAFHIEYEQPLKFQKSILKAKFFRSDRTYFNPFGTTVAPGSQRADVSLEMKPRQNSQIRLGFSDERNETENVDNHRITFSGDWTEQVRNDLRLRFGYDFRKYDAQSDTEVKSNLITLGAEWRPTEKLEFAVKREQNLGEADPTYPNQTTFAAKYKFNNLTNFFFTQRLASDAIRPISDVSTLGFASTDARNETAFGVESKVWRYSTLSGRYQIENGINGKDSFAVIGLQNSLPINKKSSIEFGYERGFRVAGTQKSFNTALLGYSWKTENFKSSVRYELRDRAGFGNILTGGAAGKINENITVLGRMQYAKGNLNDQSNKSIQGTAALSLRPLRSDKFALLFSYNTRLTNLRNNKTFETIKDRVDAFSIDGLWQVSKRLEFFSHGALKYVQDEKPNVTNVSNLTTLIQNRFQYKLGEKWDTAVEMRFLAQPSTSTYRISSGAELGYWIMSDIRLGIGYNLTKSHQPPSVNNNDIQKQGFYFNVTTKLSRIFDLFGSSKNKEIEQNDPRGNITLVDPQKQQK